MTNEQQVTQPRRIFGIILTTGVFQRHWKIKVLNPGTNTSYALQWFAMALLTLVISIVFNSNTIQLLQQPATDKPYE